MVLSKMDESRSETERQCSHGGHFRPVSRAREQNLCVLPERFLSDYPEPWYRVVISAVSVHKTFGTGFVSSQVLYPDPGTPETYSGKRIETDTFSEWIIQVQNILYSIHACIYGPFTGMVR